MIDLKWLNPCPTCGKKDEINTGQTSPGRYFIRCNRCMVSVTDDREEKVQAEWNEIGHYLRERVKELEGLLTIWVKQNNYLRRHSISDFDDIHDQTKNTLKK